jgi:hypothetical protein
VIVAAKFVVDTQHTVIGATSQGEEPHAIVADADHFSLLSRSGAGVGVPSVFLHRAVGIQRRAPGNQNLIFIVGGNGRLGPFLTFSQADGPEVQQTVALSDRGASALIHYVAGVTGGSNSGLNQCLVTRDRGGKTSR